MSAYEIKLRYEETLPGGDALPTDCAVIIARDPLQDFEFPISPLCLSAAGIRHETDRIRRALDEIDREAERRFAAHRRKIRRDKAGAD